LVKAQATVQIVHGLAEHAGRYARLAAALNSAGYVVYAIDLPGHGSACPPEELGLFAISDGWQRCLEGIESLHRRIEMEYPGLPHFLLGHSMGSFLVQQFMQKLHHGLAGVILSASDGPPNLLARAGRWVARLERARLGPRGRSALLQAFAFGKYNRAFRPNRTAYDWLSRDEREVDGYLADPACGFNPTTQLWIDLLDALNQLHRPPHLARIPKDLPVIVLAGELDPVSAKTRGLQKLLRLYQKAGLQKVTHRFYAGARHELFHETNRDEVTTDLISWLDGIVAGQPLQNDVILPRQTV
jgi:alpha-beta hydrolase superfamily lysophospholipase